jgi:hypothetical protein
MPRASWRGFLRLSLVSCPIYLSPATTRAKSIRLHQVWQPAPVDVTEDVLSDRGEGQQGFAASAPQLLAYDTGPVAEIVLNLRPLKWDSLLGRLLQRRLERFDRLLQASTGSYKSEEVNQPSGSASESMPWDRNYLDLTERTHLQNSPVEQRQTIASS